MALAAVLFATGCASLRPVDNREPVEEGLSYQAQYRSAPGEGRIWDQTAKSQNLDRCIDIGAKSMFDRASLESAVMLPSEIMLLSPGDLLTVLVGDDETFSGSYEISQDGTLRLPHLPSILALGKTQEEVQAELTDALVDGGIYNVAPPVSVRVQDFASARIYVSGAVFEPGTVSVGGVAGDEVDSLRQQASGGTFRGRRLSRALQSAGGIRPDADLSIVRVKRGDETMVIDVRPAMAGLPYDDILLIAGDHIEVDSRECFQDDLVKPSPITLPGVLVFMSNLTQPALSNANSAIGREARELRYGTRFLEAIVGMNCMGGTKPVNANRTAALISRNRLTGESIVIERRVEELLRHKDRDDFNPFMMPGDAMACYDSSVTNIVEVARGFSTVAAAAALLNL